MHIRKLRLLEAQNHNLLDSELEANGSPVTHIETPTDLSAGESNDAEGRSKLKKPLSKKANGYLLENNGQAATLDSIKRTFDIIREFVINDTADLNDLPLALAIGKREQTIKAIERKLVLMEKWEEAKRKSVQRFSTETENLLNLQIHIETEEQRLKTYKQMSALATPKRRRMCDWRPGTPLSIDGSHNGSSATSENSNSSKKRKISDSDSEENGSEYIVLGPNGTTVSRKAFNNINWNLSGPAVTRKILMEVFDRDTLAFHTLTGKPSPAFMGCDKPTKNQLDQAKVADIIHIMMERMDMTPKEVRNAITTKCADENKMYRQRQQKLAADIDRRRSAGI